jgi:site-specific DNA recombinase
MYFQFRMMMAEEEHRRIHQRTRDGKLRAMDRDNAPPAGSLTFGFKLGPQGQFLLHPVEADIVRKVFEMFLQGHSQVAIADWLNQIGIRPGRRYQKRMGDPTIGKKWENSKWWPSSISKMLRRRDYIGDRVWGGRKFPCEPIVDLPTFRKVQKKPRICTGF